MKRQLILLTILILHCAALFSQPGGNRDIEDMEIYPGKTISFDPFFTSILTVPFNGDYKYGGGMRAGFSAVDFFERVSFGISGGYSYIKDNTDSALLFSSAGVTGSYSFTLFNRIGINQVGGLFINFPHNFGDGPIVPALEGGLEIELHLSDRNFITASAGINYSFSNAIPPRAVFSFGIKRSRPLKIEMDPVEVSYRVGPERFSPDNDGENEYLEIEMWVAGGDKIDNWEIRIFDEWDEEIRSWEGGALPPLQTLWDGHFGTEDLVGSAMYYRIEMKMEDILGNIFKGSDEILTDILVKKVGGKYKIMIPNIVFPPNSADFALLSESDLARNTEIIRKIAAKLDTYPDYNVRIEGHGNLDYWKDEVLAAREQEEVLIPLTRARADMIKDVLIAEGVDGERLLTRGIGASDPIVPFSDTENLWKNRRVEFILLK